MAVYVCDGGPYKTSINIFSAHHAFFEHLICLHILDLKLIDTFILALLDLQYSMHENTNFNSRYMGVHAQRRAFSTPLQNILIKFIVKMKLRKRGGPNGLGPIAAIELKLIHYVVTGCFCS